MSYRELTMIDVKEVLRRWQAGQSARQMSREGVAGRATAGRYIEAAQQLGLTLQSELGEELVRSIAERVQARPAAEISEPRRLLEQHRVRIEAWLRCDQPLTLVRVQELLVRDGVMVPYTTLRRYAHAELGWKERAPSVRIDDPPPGEEAQVDFAENRGRDGPRLSTWAVPPALVPSLPNLPDETVFLQPCERGLRKMDFMSLRRGEGRVARRRDLSR